MAPDEGQALKNTIDAKVFWLANLVKGDRYDKKNSEWHIGAVTSTNT